MAVIRADGFDHWGSRSTMEIGGWVYTSNDGVNNVAVSTSNPRTGAYCLSFPSNVSAAYNQMSLIWDAVSDTVGIGFAHYIPANYSAAGFGASFTSLAGNGLISFMINQNNAFEIWKGNGTTRLNTLLATSRVNAIQPGSYNYIEMKVKMHATAGTVEIRVNEVTVLAFLGSTGATLASGVDIGKITTGVVVGQTTKIDDLIIWDGSGTFNNDFLGDRRCATSFPSADTVLAAWVPLSGAGYASIDEVPPSTADYIVANQPGDISEFEKGSIGVVATAVAGVQIYAYARKEDVGSSTFRLGVNSVGVVSNGPKIAPGIGWAFYNQIFELNPNGNIPWTKTAIDAANLRLTRED